jgi:hypothetical protein
MRQVPEPEHSEWVRRMRELARQDAEELVPRPPFAVLGLSAPVLRPAALAESQRVNDEWTSVTLAYGDWAGPAGPYVTVTSAAADPEAMALASRLPGRGPETELLRAIDAERNRIAEHAGVDEEEPASPPRYTRVRLPAGEALLGRHGAVWAARLLGTADVIVTLTGRGVEPAVVRLEPAGDLRPYFEARNEMLGRLAERRQRQVAALPPAEGVAALRALADFTLERHEAILESVRNRRLPRHRAGEAGRYNALWRRAVSEQQRVAGIDKRAADDVVTRVINHLGQLLEDAAWFSDPRLRDLAIDETLRYAMLGDDVPSRPAQQAWARYWGVRNERWRRSPEPVDILADVRESKPIEAAWLDAWAAWARRA